MSGNLTDQQIQELVRLQQEGELAARLLRENGILLQRQLAAQSQPLYVQQQQQGNHLAVQGPLNANGNTSAQPMASASPTTARSQNPYMQQNVLMGHQQLTMSNGNHTPYSGQAQLQHLLTRSTQPNPSSSGISQPQPVHSPAPSAFIPQTQTTNRSVQQPSGQTVSSSEAQTAAFNRTYYKQLKRAEEIKQQQLNRFDPKHASRYQNGNSVTQPSRLPGPEADALRANTGNTTRTQVQQYQQLQRLERAIQLQVQNRNTATPLSQSAPSASHTASGQIQASGQTSVTQYATSTAPVVSQHPPKLVVPRLQKSAIDNIRRVVVDWLKHPDVAGKDRAFFNFDITFGWGAGLKVCKTSNSVYIVDEHSRSVSVDMFIRELERNQAPEVPEVTEEPRFITIEEAPQVQQQPPLPKRTLPQPRPQLESYLQSLSQPANNAAIMGRTPAITTSQVTSIPAVRLPANAKKASIAKDLLFALGKRIRTNEPQRRPDVSPSTESVTLADVNPPSLTTCEVSPIAAIESTSRVPTPPTSSTNGKAATPPAPVTAQASSSGDGQPMEMTFPVPTSSTPSINGKADVSPPTPPTIRVISSADGQATETTFRVSIPSASSTSGKVPTPPAPPTIRVVSSADGQAMETTFRVPTPSASSTSGKVATPPAPPTIRVASSTDGQAMETTFRVSTPSASAFDTDTDGSSAILPSWQVLNQPNLVHPPLAKSPSPIPQLVDIPPAKSPSPVDDSLDKQVQAVAVGSPPVTPLERTALSSLTRSPPALQTIAPISTVSNTPSSGKHDDTLPKPPPPPPSPSEDNEPLFLPSSSLPSSRETTPVAYHLTSPPPKRRKQQGRPYVLVPSAPLHSIRYRQLQAEKARNLEKGKGRTITLEIEEERPRRKQPSAVIFVDEGAYDYSYDAQGNRIEDPDEQAIIEIACTRLLPLRCRWEVCDVVMNCPLHLWEHLRHHRPSNLRQGERFLCLWAECGQQCQFGDRHLIGHAFDFAECPYQGCNASMRGLGPLLGRHIAIHDKEGVPFKRSWIPLAPRPPMDQPPPIPNRFPSYQMETRKVLPASIPADRHETLEPWVKREICGLRKPRHDLKRRIKIQRSNGDDDSDDESIYRYDYLTDYPLRYSSILSEPVDNISFAPLPSEEVLADVKEGMVILENRPEAPLSPISVASSSSRASSPEFPPSPTFAARIVHREKEKEDEEVEEEMGKAAISSEDESAVETMLAAEE